MFRHPVRITDIVPENGKCVFGFVSNWHPLPSQEVGVLVQILRKSDRWWAPGCSATDGPPWGDAKSWQSGNRVN